jgi:hypothetical protein
MQHMLQEQLSNVDMDLVAEEFTALSSQVQAEAAAEVAAQLPDVPKTRVRVSLHATPTQGDMGTVRLQPRATGAPEGTRPVVYLLCLLSWPAAATVVCPCSSQAVVALLSTHHHGRDALPRPPSASYCRKLTGRRLRSFNMSGNWRHPFRLEDWCAYTHAVERLSAPARPPVQLAPDFVYSIVARGY